MMAARDSGRKDQRLSTRVFVLLIVTYALLTGLSVFLPQSQTGMPTQQVTMPASLPVMALVAGGVVLVAYGALGSLGLFLAHKLGRPGIWDSAVTNRQRFLVPAIVGAALGVLLIAGDAIFSRINGFGHFPHPPFPMSVVAALAAGIGEEVLFRLFFISFWTWVVSRVVLRGRAQDAVYWVVAVVSAVTFGVSHLPALMYLENWTTFAQVPPVSLAEILLLNGLLSIVAAAFFKKYGFLAPVGIHFWADVVWHVLWGAI